jgi:hypothetical protein
VSFIGSAQACNVFWQVGSSATLGTNSDFSGNLFASESITVTSGTDVTGRVLALARDDGDSGLWTPLEIWLGLGCDDATVWTWRHALAAALRETPEGREAARASRSKSPNPFWRLDAIAYQREFLEVASPEEVTTLLLHPNRMLVDVGRKLSNEPLAQRFEVLRSRLPEKFEDESAFPGDDPGKAKVPRFPPRVVRMADGKSRCTHCKERLAPGDRALLVGTFDLEAQPKWKRQHLTCAASNPRARANMLRALERERGIDPELQAAREALSSPSSAR